MSLQCIRKRSTGCQGVAQPSGTATHSEFRHVPTVVELQSYQALLKGFRYVSGLVPVLIPSSKLSVFAKCHHNFHIVTYSLVVTKISSRATLLSLSASPISFSVP